MSEQILWNRCENVQVLGESKKICASIIRADLSLLVRIDADGNHIDITVANLKIKLYELPSGFYIQIRLDKIIMDAENNPKQLCLTLDVCSALNCMKIMDDCINL